MPSSCKFAIAFRSPGRELDMGKGCRADEWQLD